MADNLRPAQAVQLFDNIYAGQKFSVTRQILATAVDNVIFIAQRICKVTAASLVVRVKSAGAGTTVVMLERCQAVEAPTGGDDLLTADLNLEGDVDKVQDGVLTTTSDDLILAIGDRLALYFTKTALTSTVADFTVELEMMKQDDSLPA